jgi:hypothetical protein
VLGRRVEAIVGTHEKVKALRMNPQYAMHVPDPNVVCNGLVALTALLAGEANDLLSPNQDEQLQQLAQLRDLDSTLDAYGDLLVADAVHQVVTGHADTAAEVMDAAAGLSRPPTFESVRTPPSGYLLHTSVLSMLPWVEAAVDPGAHPLLIAEPSLAAYVDQQFPDLAGTIWQARGKRLDGDVESDIAGAVSLADLGLTVAEAALLPEDLLAGGVAAFLAIERLEEIASPVQVRVARQMMGALGGQPAIARTLVAEGELAGDEQTQLDAAVHDELAGRFATLVAACQDTAAALESAADDTARVAALRRALYWGVVPSVAPEEQRSLYRALFAGKLPADVTLLPRLAVAAANALGIQNEQGDVVGGRLAGAPAQVPQRIPELARALAELATADGKLSILGRWARADFQAKTCIQSNDVDDGLDEDWLTLLAPIRPNLARLEALQLQAGQPNMHQGLQPRTNSPGDPWQTAVVQENRRHREQGRPTDLSLQRFIAAYSAPRAWESDQVAVGLLDEFGESIPMPQRTTFVAFGFNAPAARPPQAILLAVPPKPRMHIDATLILDIVAETRELAHARAARVSDLGEYQSLAPGMWFHGSGPDRVRLDNSSQYWR